MTDPSSTSENSPPRERLVHVALSGLVRAPNSPKPQPPPPELVDSIRTYGLLQPLLVRPGEDGYEVVAGFKRLEAAREARLEEVPVRVYRVEDAALAGLREASNVQGKTRSKVPTSPVAGDYKATGPLSGLLEEELNRAPSETPYVFILTIAAVILGLVWGGILLAKRWTGGGESVLPAATATPSGGSVLFPDETGDASPGSPNETQEVARWRTALSGIDGVEVRNVANVPRVVFSEAVFSSLTTIDPDQKPTLVRVAEAVREEASAAMLVVIGHTDDDPVRPNSTYRSNEHLGLLRAQAVMAFLAESTPLPPHQLRAQSAGAQNPPFSNQNATDKVRNRTVTIEIISPR